MSSQFQVTPFAPIIDGSPLQCLEETEASRELQLIQRELSGVGEPANIAVASQAPKFGGSTSDLETLLGLATTILDKGFAATGGNTVQQFRSWADTGGADAIGGATHVTVTSAKSFVVVDSISAKQGETQYARAKFMCYLLRNGATLPQAVAITASVTDYAAVTDTFALGPAYINDGATPVIIGGVQSSEYVMNAEVVPRNGDGHTHPDGAHLTKTQRQIKLSVQNKQVLSDYGLQGLSDVASGSTLDLYFRKIDPVTGDRVADGTAEHLRIRMTNPKVHVENITLPGGNAPSEPGLVFTNVNDEAVTFDFATTIGQTA